MFSRGSFQPLPLCESDTFLGPVSEEVQPFPMLPDVLAQLALCSAELGPTVTYYQLLH